MKNRHPFFVAVYLIARRGSSILIADRKNTGYADGQWSLVAGHVEAQEPTFQALAREAREEAGIEVAVDDMKVVHVMHRNCGPENSRYDVFIEAKNFSGEPYIAEPEKCSQMMWVTLDQLPDNTVPYVREALHRIASGEMFSEYGWDYTM